MPPEVFPPGGIHPGRKGALRARDLVDAPAAVRLLELRPGRGPRPVLAPGRHRRLLLPGLSPARAGRVLGRRDRLHGLLRHRQPAAHGERRALPHSPRRRGAAHSREGGAKAVAASLEAPRGQCVEAPRRRDGGAILSGILREDAERLASGAELPAPTATPRSYTAAHTPPSTTYRATPSSSSTSPARFAEAARNYIKRVTELVTGLVSAGKLSAVPEDYFTPFDAAMRRLRAMALYMADSFTAGRYAVSPKSIVTVRAKQLPSYAGSASQAAEDLASYPPRGLFRRRARGRYAPRAAFERIPRRARRAVLRHGAALG